MINKEHTQQINIRTSINVQVEELLRWRDPHCPDSLLLQEEFSHVDNENDFWMDSEEELTRH
ncbi:hypothetical protein [Neptunomonas japonica]|uniref:hypothetical protein n=1 Tax=Neptunomonas japonica TaxID=417574 RepID=UPI00040CE982|nr:hypothetical protein [Neptunomonas japonica]